MKEDQWVLLEQLTKVLELLQMATTVFGHEVTVYVKTFEGENLCGFRGF